MFDIFHLVLEMAYFLENLIEFVLAGNSSCEGLKLADWEENTVVGVSLS